MRVTRLEIFGFKSFLEKLTLPLEVGFTGVVGPNGCGKSNIVDAIRWILGETRASQLRGGTLEDVIFNGTDKLRPLGLAEVTLSLRSAGQDFFSEIVSSLTKQGNQFAAIVADQEATQDAESEEGDSSSSAEEIGNAEGGMGTTSSERAGGAPRLTVISGNKDQREGLQDGAADEPSTGAGLLVVEGGGTTTLGNTLGNNAADDSGTESTVAIDQELDVDPQTLAFESSCEASAIDENVNEVGEACDEEYAKKALGRFGWLRNVQEVQITRRLYRSGESEFFINRVACRLKDIKELFRLCGIGARAYTIVAQGEVGRIVTSRPEERRLIIEEAAGVAGFREKIGAASRRLEETNQNLVRLEDIAKEVQRQVNSLRVQAARARSRQELKDRIVVVEERLFAGEFSAINRERLERERELQEKQELERSANAVVERIMAEEQEARGLSFSTDVEGDDIRRKIDSITDELRLRSEKRAQCVSRVTEMTARLHAARREHDAQCDRRATLFERKGESERTISELERSDAELVTELGQIGGGFDDLVRQIADELKTLRAQLATQEQQFRSSRDALVSAKSRLETISEQIEASSPISHMKDLLSVGGSAKRFSLSETEASSDTKSAEQRLGEVIERLGTSSSLLTSGLRVPEELERAVHAALGDKLSSLLVPDALDIAGDYGALVASPTADSRQKDNGQNRYGQKGNAHNAPLPAVAIFSKERAGSSEEPAVQGVPFPGLLSLVEVQAGFMDVATRLLGGVFLAPSAEAAVAFFRELGANSPGAISSGSTSSHLVLVTPQGELITSDGYEYAGKVETGVLRLQREAEALREEIVALEAQYQSLVQFRAEVQEQIVEADRRHGEALAESRRQQVRAREVSNQQGAVRGRLQSERRVLAQLEQDLGRSDQSIAQFEQEILGAQEQLAVREAELAQLDTASDAVGEAHDLNAELLELRQSWQGIEAKRSATRESLGRIAQQLQMARNECERVRAAMSRAELEIEKSSLERSALELRVLTDHGEEFWASNVIPLAESLGEAGLAREEQRELSEEVAKIRARIAREGEVDTSSIQRFEEEQARLTELTLQREDLTSAARTLARTIEMLRETSEQRFLSTFKAVKRNFSNLIPRLFGGGKASLDLSDPNRPLESGIDISVRPPGKKLKSIELMSGGEKALCAIALIVAMFMERPSPLCVLDEVDAPLDEANLVRFLSLLKDMSHMTQFVVVTHNKQTMTVADQLIGVTMQQPGASTVVTVSLQEAVRHVA